MLDVIIRGGDVVDGTGAPRRRADVGIKDGRIETIGDLTGVAAVQDVDAAGRVVAPGFVDVHTHFDAQVFWDTTLSPSPLHGVTTVLAGNCGFTIAPLSADPSDGAYLKRMLARVEGMPLESLETGVPWGAWTSFGEYLDRIDNTLAVNAGFMVGHSALRRVVMGTDSCTREATPDEQAAMERLLHDSLAAGGLGFSSSWARTHNDADGHMVPSRYATRDELVALAGVAGQHEGTSLEFIPCVGPFEDWAVELMADMSATARRPLNWNVMAVSARTLDDARAKLAAGDVARARGGKVVALTVPMSFGVRLSLDSGFILDALPGWEHFVALPRAEKLEILADPERRRRLDEQAQQEGPLRQMASWGRMILFDTFAPENEAFRGRTVAEVAEELGVPAWDALCQVVVADELRTSFGTPNPPESDEDWAARVEVWRDRRALIGASDAGAHLDLLASFNYSTIMLDQAVRRRGLLPLEEAVHLVTDRPARLYGLRERGRVTEGWWADIVVFDEHGIGSDPVAMRFDLPGGSGRLYAEGQGIDHVFCNGAEIVRHGEFTPSRPGTVLRSGRDTADPDLD